MNTTDPNTWHDLSHHPSFHGGEFDPNWYDGNVKEDLDRLRLLSLEIIKSFPDYSCELVVLDDCTMYARFDRSKSTVAAIYPAKTDEGQACFFVDRAGREELRCQTTKEIVDILY